ncbi:MAG: penicillin-binding transpeptidase domain-containing protein, partial [Solirubrobacteraceae bacterium]
LATQGQRQPGSSFKPFILASALKAGIGPGSVWPSRKRVFSVPNSPEKFTVNNFESTYTGAQTLAGGLTFSDNAVYSAVGIKVGTKKVARLARRMGIRTPISTNYAMTLGGLREGVTPLDMAHAFETFITHGRRIEGTLGSGSGPVGIDRVGNDRNEVISKPVLPRGIADQTVGIMSSVVSQGTGVRAALGDGVFAAGKTGTTENSGDAWFVGFTERMTVAVWVGYPNKLKPMLTEFQGGPVEGGTFPAIIWHSFMQSANKILDDRTARERVKKGLPPVDTTTTTSPVPTPPPVPSSPSTVPEGGAAAPAPTPTTSTPSTPPSTPSAPPTQSTPATPPPSSSGTPTGGGTSAGGGASAPPSP